MLRSRVLGKKEEEEELSLSHILIVRLRVSKVGLVDFVTGTPSLPTGMLPKEFVVCIDIDIRHLTYF